MDDRGRDRRSRQSTGQVHPEPARQPRRQRADEDGVELGLAEELLYPAHWVVVDDLSTRRHPEPLQPVELVLEAASGQRMGDLLSAGDVAVDGWIVPLGLPLTNRDRCYHDHLGITLGVGREGLLELGAPQRLVGYDQDPRHGFIMLPKRREEGDLTLVHGSPRDPTWEYVTSTSIAKASLSAISTRHGLHGHTHIPVVFTELDGRLRTLEPRAGNSVDLSAGRMLLNPGSVGQPRDGDPRASYLVLDTEAGTATWGRVAYDFEAVGNAMRALGLPERLADRLRHGT